VAIVFIPAPMQASNAMAAMQNTAALPWRERVPVPSAPRSPYPVTRWNRFAYEQYILRRQSGWPNTKGIRGYPKK